MTLMEKVLKEAEPHMKGKGLTVVDGIIGFNFAGVQLSNGRCHFIYLMREAIPSGDDIFPYGEQMIGMDAWEVAQWALTGAEDLQRSLGVAALNAASPYHLDPAYQQIENFYNCVTEDTVLGVIGYMPPLLKQFGKGNLAVKNYGKRALTLVHAATGEGVRVHVELSFPEGLSKEESAKWVLTVDPETICKAVPVKIDVPQRKPITYVRCDNCMEEFAQFCGIQVGSRFCCPECATKLQ